MEGITLYLQPLAYINYALLKCGQCVLCGSQCLLCGNQCLLCGSQCVLCVNQCLGAAQQRQYQIAVNGEQCLVHSKVSD